MKKKTYSEKNADKNAKANKIRKIIGGKVGSPFREQQIILGKEKMLSLSYHSAAILIFIWIRKLQKN